MKIISKSLAETDIVARDFLKELQEFKKTDQNTGGAVVVGLFGELGSGKTTFSQALGRHLRINEFMTSPTFVIEKIYKLDGKNDFDNLIHIDAYRLEKGRELEVLGFKELLKDSKNLILIEWPERVADIMPDNMIKIYFKFISENEREIEK
jgi:tRNA threonylcarbamoyladenosine biosynthesis protein TsaE